MTNLWSQVDILVLCTDCTGVSSHFALGQTDQHVTQSEPDQVDMAIEMQSSDKCVLHDSNLISHSWEGLWGERIKETVITQMS